MPALAKQLSTLPSVATVVANVSSTLVLIADVADQVEHACASRGGRAGPAAPSFFAALVPQMATSAPCSAKASAMPRPMPLLPPVTRATWPVRSNGLYAMVKSPPVVRNDVHHLDLIGGTWVARKRYSRGRIGHQGLALRSQERRRSAA